MQEETSLRDPLECLAEEISLNILAFLQYEDLLRAAAVSKQWRLLADDDAGIWVRIVAHKGRSF